MSYSFTDKFGTQKLFSIGSIIDGPYYTPSSGNPKAVYTYSMGTGSQRKLVAVSGGNMAPLGMFLFQVIGDLPSSGSAQTVPTTVTNDPMASSTTTFVSGPQKVSPGAVYVNPSGTYIDMPQGSPVPDAWVIATPPPAANVIEAPSTYIPPTIAQSGGSNISTGGVYINPSGTYVNIPAGQAVPDLWRPAVGALAPPSNSVIIQAPDTAAIVRNYEVIYIIETLIGIVGVAGIAYLGYTIVTKPEAAKIMLSKITAFKDLVVDISQILIAGAIITVASLAGYEFWAYYDHYGSVGKALQYMTQDFITNVLTVIVDILVGAGKALINFWNKSGLSGALLSGVSLAGDLASGMSWKDSVDDSFQAFTGGSSTVQSSDGWTQ